VWPFSRKPRRFEVVVRRGTVQMHRTFVGHRKDVIDRVIRCKQASIDYLIAHNLTGDVTVYDNGQPIEYERVVSDA
jgi:hypothetical protein